MAGAKTGRRGGAGGQSATPTGAAVPASTKPGAALPEAQPAAERNGGYAPFVRQRKDSVAHAVRIRREQGVAQAQQMADLKARRAFERALADHERAIDEFWRRFFRRLPRQRTETSDPNRGERRAIEAVARRELAKVSRRREFRARLERRSQSFCGQRFTIGQDKICGSMHPTDKHVSSIERLAARTVPSSMSTSRSTNTLTPPTRSREGQKSVYRGGGCHKPVQTYGREGEPVAFRSIGHLPRNPTRRTGARY